MMTSHNYNHVLYMLNAVTGNLRACEGAATHRAVMRFKTAITPEDAGQQRP